MPFPQQLDSSVGRASMQKVPGSIPGYDKTIPANDVVVQQHLLMYKKHQLMWHLASKQMKLGFRTETKLGFRILDFDVPPTMILQLVLVEYVLEPLEVWVSFRQVWFSWLLLTK